MFVFFITEVPQNRDPPNPSNCQSPEVVGGNSN